MNIGQLRSTHGWLVLGLLACSSGSTRPDAQRNLRDDAGTSSTADGGATDAGPPPCVRDQDCPSGEVCNMISGKCIAGLACTGQPDCDRCSDRTRLAECGHGFHVNAYCDDRHGNVCVRSLAPCEPCADDKDCGPLHIQLRAAADPSKCLDYGNGKKFCGRDSSLGCPLGMLPDQTTGQCKAETCEPIVLCPAHPSGRCPSGNDQICPDADCPGGGGSFCANNDLPGNVGICVHACRSAVDCTDPAKPFCNPLTGVCGLGCSPGSCAGGEVCHVNGQCGSPCSADNACETRFGSESYCNLRGGRPLPRSFKNQHDENSCQALGCESRADCPAAGMVCDRTTRPPQCVVGCYARSDCARAEEVCRAPGAGGPKPSYSVAECRALGAKGDPSAIGVCCYPGCTDRVGQCYYNEFCCGEEDSPYEETSKCGTVTPTTGGSPRQAAPGECFPIAPKPASPFCVKCGAQGGPACSSDNYDGAQTNWTAGYNRDSNINQGQPFREQEVCYPVAQDTRMCTVTCNPNAPDHACPRLWECRPLFPLCLQDSECNGLVCDGEDNTTNPPRYGRCLCGENGAQTAQCPNSFTNFGTVDHPRCIAHGADGKMFCVASYNCLPPPITEESSGKYNYPEACLQ